MGYVIKQNSNIDLFSDKYFGNESHSIMEIINESYFPINITRSFSWWNATSITDFPAQMQPNRDYPNVVIRRIATGYHVTISATQGFADIKHISGFKHNDDSEIRWGTIY